MSRSDKDRGRNARRIGRRLLSAALAFAVSGTAGAAAPVAAEEITKIAFGSCLRQTLPQPIWKPILAADPDVFVFLGDNVYADTVDPEQLRAVYRMLGDREEYRTLRERAEIVATWDDHDYGVNDAGADNPGKQAAEDAFLDFFEEPADSERRRRPGVYDAKVFGPAGRRVQIVVLDTRTFRSPLVRGSWIGGGKYVPNRDPAATMLGPAQWAWLEKQLAEPAELRIVASSTQVVHDGHEFESWGTIPHERSRLLELLSGDAVGPVVVLSGDRHFAEISRWNGEDGRVLYDVTSSSMNHPRRRIEDNEYRVGPAYYEANFGMVRIDWQAAPPEVTIEIVGVDGSSALRMEKALLDRRGDDREPDKDGR